MRMAKTNTKEKNNIFNDILYGTTAEKKYLDSNGLSTLLIRIANLRNAIENDIENTDFDSGTY